MAKYAVFYEGVLEKTVIVEADNPDEAIKKVKWIGVTLDYNDYDHHKIFISKDANRDGTTTENQLEYCEHFDESEDE